MHAKCPPDEEEFHLVVRHRLEKTLSFSGGHQYNHLDMAVWIPPNSNTCNAASYPFPQGYYSFLEKVDVFDPNSEYTNRDPFVLDFLPDRANYTLCLRQAGIYTHHPHVTCEVVFEHPCSAAVTASAIPAPALAAAAVAAAVAAARPATAIAAAAVAAASFTPTAITTTCTSAAVAAAAITAAAITAAALTTASIAAAAVAAADAASAKSAAAIPAPTLAATSLASAGPASAVATAAKPAALPASIAAATFAAATFTSTALAAAAVAAAPIAATASATSALTATALPPSTIASTESPTFAAAAIAAATFASAAVTTSTIASAAVPSGTHPPQLEHRTAHAHTNSRLGARSRIGQSTPHIIRGETLWLATRAMGRMGQRGVQTLMHLHTRAHRLLVRTRGSHRDPALSCGRTSAGSSASRATRTTPATTPPDRRSTWAGWRFPSTRSAAPTRGCRRLGWW